jgi:cytochrome bd ubiquinol oxidase subunit II
MTELAVMFIGISLLLYVLLGGADFGAGIIEIFTGKKGVDTISKAIAPVWEANHIWIIVVIVILFNAFPEVYSTTMLYLHIPVMLILVGIIFRGTSFAFRYYDPYHDRSHKVYTFIFKLFSLLTPFFLGVTMGAVMLGKITTDNNLPYFDRFVAPWLSLFGAALGIFVVVLFAFLAAVYLTGEPAEEAVRKKFRGYVKNLLISLVISGALVFLAAESGGLSLFSSFCNSWIGITSVIMATLLMPVFVLALNRGKDQLTRFIAGAQTVFILLGWFGVQFPDMVVLKNEPALGVYTSAAPLISLKMMIIALVVGLALVIPLLIFLFKVFKFNDKYPDNDY